MPSSLPSAPWRGVFLAACAAVLSAAFPASAETSSLALTPAPRLVEQAAGAFPLDRGVEIVVPDGDAGARNAASFLAGLIARSHGFTPDIREGAAGARPAIVFETSQVSGPEAYALTVGPDRAVIQASGDGGRLYGATTFWQLATQAPGARTVPAVRVEDAPRFGWRGLMLDSARHFQSVEFIKRFIDQMAVYKLNVLHWHLTDDQGWRLEIRKYPRLTGAGACRVPAGEAQKDIDPATGRPREYCGYYTQDQVREIVAYAAARNITIVPEIDMPGHAQAALVAYPEIGAALTPPKTVEADWGVFPYLFGVDDTAMGFARDVLDEVVELFPSPYIHVGGDEAVKDQWKANPAVQARMKALGVKDEHALQSWFIHELELHLKARGRRLIGWDEILEGGLAPDATVMSWRGLDGAVAAARMGHDTVLSPQPMLYLNHRQSGAPEEQPGRGKVVTLKEVYAFDPAPSQMTVDERRHVLGVQATLWTEHMRTEDRVWRSAWPRAAAVAEAGWSDEGRRSWAGFSARLPVETARLALLGNPFDILALEPTLVADRAGRRVRVGLGVPAGAGEIRYTTDGSTPTAKSPLYGEPITVPLDATVQARTFVDGRPLGEARRWTADARLAGTRYSGQLAMCSDKLNLALEDDAPLRGERAVFLIDILEPCWRWNAADLTGVSRIEVAVGQLPFNFQIGKDIEKITFRPPATPAGELEVRAGGCKGERIGVLPLAPAVDNPAVTVLTGAIASRSGKQDLCFTFTQRGVEPMWAIDRVTLVPGAMAGGK
ncbi:family 20 glycosylhydrolase [Caulobacter mirabilis]|uniref:beta-N-acetylhexosaminidase n=1 Tax=Caulobacter mirabilis TaxID=69666 RepID=A0A2D2B1P7_9CAUL|nr:family 20 glycosylhydrolase [Caulobacter mirabilis]ATQ44127.1 beta-hexosaminidase [Caulobacter mirabilis]